MNAIVMLKTKLWREKTVIGYFSSRNVALGVVEEMIRHGVQLESMRIQEIHVLNELCLEHVEEKTCYHCEIT